MPPFEAAPWPGGGDPREREQEKTDKTGRSVALEQVAKRRPTQLFLRLQQGVFYDCSFRTFLWGSSGLCSRKCLGQKRDLDI